MIPRSGIDEVSLTSEDTGKFRFTLNILQAFDADGGHLETKGLSPTGQVVKAPQHRHLVSLDFFRAEVGLEYRLADNWKTLLSVPYEIKNQDASSEEIDPSTAVEQKSILANQHIHHRDEIYRGFSDFSLRFSHKKSSVLNDDDHLVIALGTSIPMGKTEEDPFKLGNAGLEHLHIQFGTGTFDPLAELHYNTPLFGDFSLNASVRGRFPFYENSKTYRGSVEVTATTEVKYHLLDWLAFHTTYLRFYQSYAHWDGKRDINSGLVLNAFLFGAMVNIGYSIPIRFSVMLPFHRRTLSDEGDAFELGQTVSLTVSRSF